MESDSVYIWIDDVACVSLQALIDEGISWMKPTLRKDGGITYPLWSKWMSKAKKVGYHTRRASNSRPSLIAYNAIPDNYRAKLQQIFGTPERENEEVKLFARRVQRDEVAAEYYRNYVLDDGRTLPAKHQDQYTQNASVLNAVAKSFTDQKAMLLAHGKLFRPPYQKMAAVLKEAKEILHHNLPTHHKNFRTLYLEYQSAGYESLISRKWCNSNSEKITDEIEEWFVREMAYGRQSADMVYMKYRDEAQSRGWRSDITRQAFAHRAAQPAVKQLIYKLRHGDRAFRQKYGQTFKLQKPRYANDLWVGDGTQLSWYYRATEVTKSGRQRTILKTCTTYMVIDAATLKFIGYDTQEGINKENFRMQLNSYRMAVRNGNAKPYQVLFDNQGGHKTSESRSFYGKLASVAFPTRAHRPSGKPVEQAFGKFQEMFLSELPFWTGYNRASHSKQNYAPDYDILYKNIDSLPDFDDVLKLLEVFVQKWNGWKGYDNDQLSPNALYANKRNPAEKAVTMEEMAELFWDVQGPKKYQATGIKLRIDGEEKLYEVYDENGDVDYAFRRNHLRERFYLRYDPDQDIETIELLQEHSTGGLQKVADAEPKRSVERGVKYLDADDKSWIDKQMQLEGEMLDEMENEAEQIGYDTKEKFTRWKEMLNTEPVAAGFDEDDDDIESLLQNRL